MTAQDETEVNDYIGMGGTANLFTITEKSGMGVQTGTNRRRERAGPA